jgi:lipoate---protein ligase
MGAVPRDGHEPICVSWSVRTTAGSAADAHHDIPRLDRREVYVRRIRRPALVLGSAMAGSAVDRAAAEASGVELVVRRSGGGAVYLVPDEFSWVDLVVPAADPLWDPDAAVAFHWVGEAWVEALGSVGIESRIHRGRLTGGDLARLVCFCGLGPGEVTTGGRKLVGISQRRTRAGSWFQCVAFSVMRPEGLLSLLHLDPAVRDRAASVLREATAPVVEPLGALEAALLETLHRR